MASCGAAAGAVCPAGRDGLFTMVRLPVSRFCTTWLRLLLMLLIVVRLLLMLVVVWRLITVVERDT